MSLLEPGRQIDGRYEIEALIGQGGMAVVYRARHLSLGTYHAIKVLTVPAVSIQERLLKEGRVQAALQHPNIVSVTDVVVIDGNPGLVMEYVRGPSLDQLLDRKKLSLDQADAIAAGLFDGLEAAHRLGLVHRDLKPANVMLALSAGGISPKITDFGLVKMIAGEGQTGSAATRTGMAMGTPAYMSPEQIRDAKTVDHRADLFALGCIFYELLTGYRLYDAEDIVQIFVKVTTGDRVPIRQHLPDIPVRMEQAIEACLALNPTDRPADVAALRRLWKGDTQLDLTWDDDFLAQAASLGSGGESADAVLARSWASPSAMSAPKPPQPAPGPHPDAMGQSPATFLLDGAPSPGAGPTLAPEAPSAASEAQTLLLPPVEAAPTLDDEPEPVRKPLPVALWLGLPLGLLAITAITAGGLFIGGWMATAPPTPPEPVPEAVQAVPEPAPEPAPAVALAAPEPAPEPVGTAEPAPATAPKPAPVKLQPAPQAPQPAPTPAPAGTADATQAPAATGPAHFRLPSDLTVALRSPGGADTLNPNAVPPGPVELWVWFDKDRPDASQRFTTMNAEPDQTYTVNCSSAARRCTVKQSTR